MPDVLVELLIFLVLHLGAWTGPKRTGSVDAFPLGLGRLVFLLTMKLFRQFDRQRDVVGVFLDDVAKAPTVGKLFFARLEVQNDASATFRLLDVRNLEIALAFRGPIHAFFCRRTGAAAEHLNLLRDDEGGIEANAELTDQV